MSVGDTISLARQVAERIRYDLPMVNEWDIELIIQTYESIKEKEK